jgi:WD40 repeat protein
VHLWSAATGARRALMREPPAGGPAAEAGEGEWSDESRHITALLALGDGLDGRLVAGLADGRLRYIDAAVGKLLVAWRCAPAGGPAGAAPCVRCLSLVTPPAAAGGPPLLVAGLASGALSLLDGRAGGVVATWRAHGDAMTTLLPAPFDHGQLLSGSADRTIALWDVRRLAATGGAGGAAAAVTPVMRFSGHCDPISALQLHGRDALSAAGGRVAALSLGAEAPRDAHSAAVVLSPGRLRTQRGAKEKSAIGALALLPTSRLLLVAAEDGIVRVCI